jgi:DNA-binding SARP family transcriptional activator
MAQKMPVFHLAHRVTDGAAHTVLVVSLKRLEELAMDSHMASLTMADSKLANIAPMEEQKMQQYMRVKENLLSEKQKIQHYMKVKENLLSKKRKQFSFVSSSFSSSFSSFSPSPQLRAPTMNQSLEEVRYHL